MQKAANAAAQFVDQTKGQIQQLNSGFSTLKTTFGAVVAAFAGGEIAEKLSQMAERAEAMRNSAEIFNLSTTALQGLQVMAGEAGISTESLQRSMATLESRMRAAGESGGLAAGKFTALGISVEELRDPTFTVQDAMARMGASTNSSAALLAALGARGAALIPVMRELAANHNAAAEAAQRVGALTEQEIAVLGRYHGEIANVNTEWQNFSSRVLSQAAPALAELQQQLFNVLTAGTKVGGIAETARSVSAEFLKWATAAKDLYADLTHIFETVGTSLGNVGAVFAAAATGHFAQAKEIWAEGTADLAAIDKAHDDQIKANHQALAVALQAIDQSILQPVDVTARYRTTEPLPQIAGFEKLTRLSSKYAEDLIADDNRILQDMRKTAEGELAVAEETALGKIEASATALSEELKDGEVTSSQYLAQMRALIQQRLTLLVNYYSQKRALDTGDVAAEEADDREIAKAHADALKQEQTAENTARQASLAQWQQLGRSMETSFASNITGMIEGTKTFSNAVRSMFATLIDGIIQMFVKMGIQWIENMILGKTAAAGQISANAGVAASAAMGSAAAIPFVGWAMAPAVGAATFAEALGYESAAVAERGYDIPAGVNPMVQAHAREMILPADIAETIRTMTASSAGAGGMSEHHNYNGALHVNALDARSFAQMVAKPGNRAALVRAARQHVMRGGR